MSKNSYKFFRNTDCEYFPCHSCDKAVEDSFNCLFCYCPLYALGNKCGGNYKYLENGIKDCSGCMLPHSKGGYEYIIAKYPEIASLALSTSDKG